MEDSSWEIFMNQAHLTTSSPRKVFWLQVLEGEDMGLMMPGGFCP